jgi:hypothetical protein
VTARRTARHRRARVSPWLPLGVGAVAFVVLLGVVLLVGVVTDPDADGRALTSTSLGPAPSSTSTSAAPTTTTVEETATTEAVVRPPAEVRVLVLNAAGIAGVAGRVSNDLVDAGYVPIEPGNADVRPSSAVLVRPGSESECEAARLVVQPRWTTDLLVGPITDAPPLAAVDEAECVVIIGEDIAVTD